jgi:hypothetical protein
MTWLAAGTFAGTRAPSSSAARCGPAAMSGATWLPHVWGGYGAATSPHIGRAEESGAHTQPGTGHEAAGCASGAG